MKPLWPGELRIVTRGTVEAGSDKGDKGPYVRDTRYLNARIPADGRDGWPVDPGRYRLAVARACPWANRAVIVRRLLGSRARSTVRERGPTGALGSRRDAVLSS